jgi:hypothetical protein
MVQKTKKIIKIAKTKTVKKNILKIKKPKLIPIIKCDKSLTFEECELFIVRSKVDLAQKKLGEKAKTDKIVQNIIKILENFIKKKENIIYGGLALNNLLPKKDQFYNKDIELPDYDIYSYDAINQAKELCNIFYKKGYEEVEAKSGMHNGTYKVFVNFIPILDITNINKELYETLKKDCIKKNGFMYAPINFLRMSMYLELSRPNGDTDRWEKITKRLSLLNKNYPLTKNLCKKIKFQREMDNQEKENEIYEITKNTLIEEHAVFFGGFGLSLYSKYMPKEQQIQIKKIADFDVLCGTIKKTSEKLKINLETIKMSDGKNAVVNIIKRPAIGEIIPEQTEISINNDIIVVLYPPVACHSFNLIYLDNKYIRVATIDTMLSFYLAFLYANKIYYDENRIVCMAKFLFDVQQKNRLEQKGLLKRFTITCYGHQENVQEIRAKKSNKFKELKDKKDNPEYEKWFLNYKPTENNKIKI